MDRKLIPKKLEKPVTKTFFDKLQPIEDESIEKIMISMIDGENTPTKTEVNEPTNLTRLEMFAEWYRLEGYPEIADFITSFVDKFRINMISKKRKSRQEIVQMVSEMNKERSTSEKLASVPQKGAT